MKRHDHTNDRSRKGPTMRRNHAKLVFDSDACASGVVTRSALGDERTVCFEYGRHCVDLMVHRDLDGLRVIHGQLFDPAAGTAVRDAEVSMGGCEERTVTDEYGEFALSTTSTAGLAVLWIDAADEQFACSFRHAQLDRAESREVGMKWTLPGRL